MSLPPRSRSHPPRGFQNGESGFSDPGDLVEGAPTKILSTLAWVGSVVGVIVASTAAFIFWVSSVAQAKSDLAIAHTNEVVAPINDRLNKLDDTLSRINTNLGDLEMTTATINQRLIDLHR